MRVALPAYPQYVGGGSGSPALYIVVLSSAFLVYTLQLVVYCAGAILYVVVIGHHLRRGRCHGTGGVEGSAEEIGGVDAGVRGPSGMSAASYATKSISPWIH